MEHLEILWILFVCLSFNFLQFNCDQKFLETILCHPNVKKQSLKSLQDSCSKDYKTYTPEPRMLCSNACMLGKLGILVPSAAGDGTVEMEEYSENSYVAYILQNHLSLEDAKAHTVAKTVYNMCKDKLAPINEQKLHCDKWTNLYDCVSEAMKCQQNSNSGYGLNWE